MTGNDGIRHMITGCPGIKKRKQTQRPGMLPVYNFGSLFICIVCFCPWLIGQECPFIFGPSIHIGVIVFVIHRSEPLEPDYRSTDNLQQRQSTEYFCIFSHCLEKILSYRSTVPQLSSSCLTHFCNFLIDNRI